MAAWCPSTKNGSNKWLPGVLLPKMVATTGCLVSFNQKWKQQMAAWCPSTKNGSNKRLPFSSVAKATQAIVAVMTPLADDSLL